VLRPAPLAPNVLIVDEAGQLPLAQGACAGLTGAGSILLFGDDMQMPPVFTEAVAGDPCAVSVFARLREQHPELVPLLDVTYRLNRGLCDAIGSTFYDGRLGPSASAAGRRIDAACAAAAESPFLAAVLAPEAPLVWVPSDAGGCTQHNAVEAPFVAEVLATALRGGLKAGEVAAVTPFRRQAMAIRGELQARLPTGSELPIVDTVERVQGQTVELVAISACASDRAYVREIGGFILSPNRLNVAASRARTKVVLTAHPAVMEEVPSEYDAVLAQRAWRRLVGRATVVPLPAEGS